MLESTAATDVDSTAATNLSICAAAVCATLQHTIVYAVRCQQKFKLRDYDVSANSHLHVAIALRQ
jgi:hypothetical protein